MLNVNFELGQLVFLPRRAGLRSAPLSGAI